MLQQESIVRIVDNTGAKTALVIRVLGGSKKRYGYIGDVVIVSVKSCISNSNIKKGEKSRAVIVRTVYKKRRYDGSYISFDDNACILINNNGEMLGTRVFGPVARELREKYPKIVSLASEVL